MLFFGILAVVGFSATLPVVEQQGLSPWPNLLCIAVGVFDIAFALLWHRLGRRTSLVLVGLTIIAVLITMGMNDEGYATPGRPFAPFDGHKILLVVLALLAPSGLWGALLILGSTLAVLVQYLTWPPELTAFAPALEPWQTAIIGVAALGVLRARRRHVRMIGAAVRTSARHAWVERVANLSLAVRDLANSPLQTLVLGSALVRDRCLGHSELLDRLDGATARLLDLSRFLEPLAPLVRPGQAVIGFDALVELQREIAESIRDLRSAAVPDVEIEAVAPERGPAEAALWISWVFGVVALAFLVLLEWKGFPVLPALTVVIAGFAGVGLLLTRPTLPSWASMAVIVVQTVIVLTASALATSMLANTGLPFAPFSGVKIMVLVLMVLVPAGAVGGGLIVAASVLPVIETLTWSAEVRSRVPATEPWLTLAISLTGVVVLFVRRRHVVMLRRAARLRAETAWFERLARVSLLSERSFGAVRRSFARGHVKGAWRMCGGRSDRRAHGDGSRTSVVHPRCARAAPAVRRGALDRRCRPRSRDDRARGPGLGRRGEGAPVTAHAAVSKSLWAGGAVAQRRTTSATRQLSQTSWLRRTSRP